MEKFSIQGMNQELKVRFPRKYPRGVKRPRPSIWPEGKWTESRRP